eukprot:GHVR01140093.1.p1 GENE.GHVR01140093.1~~GHVR01140093.1.p1  ORF type:complete len:122 (-),score=17.45 GHVR01140093.1:168-533(-)
MKEYSFMCNHLNFIFRFFFGIKKNNEKNVSLTKLAQREANRSRYLQLEKKNWKKMTVRAHPEKFRQATAACGGPRCREKKTGRPFECPGGMDRRIDTERQRTENNEAASLGHLMATELSCL